MDIYIQNLQKLKKKDLARSMKLGSFDGARGVEYTSMGFVVVSGMFMTRPGGFSLFVSPLHDMREILWFYA